ncbi:MAG: helix-turn-helix domain-containing protein [Thermodesulfobacteriota bacterium]
MIEPLDNPPLRLAFDYVRYTGRNVFLTGKAGTGKTTFLQTLKAESPKRMIVVAPTGVAAINAGGVTIHSFFQLPFGPQVPDMDFGAERPGSQYRFSRQKIDIIRSLDLLIIDEISMVRADLLDGVDAVLRRFRPGDRPFGGLQLLMIGDLQQLAPVVKNDEWEILRGYYETMFFFSSRALARTSFISIELKHIYRQSDRHFIDLLAKVRENRMEENDFIELNKRCLPLSGQEVEDGTITLTTHNHQARKINEARLAALPGKEKRFQARVEGEFPAYAFPTDAELVLKPGAQVMFVKNDSSPEKKFFNGKIGKLKGFTEDGLVVECPGETGSILVEPAEWKNIKYALNETTKVIEEAESGKFIQFPLKPAWAITIHKSQGLTFDKVIIDARAAFADGQVYVALSRCRTLEGLVLSTPIENHSIRSNAVVGEFTRRLEQNTPDQDQLKEDKRNYQVILLEELFDFSALLRGLFHCLKITGEYRTVLAGVTPAFFGSRIEAVKAEITGVADKFSLQRGEILKEVTHPEASPVLQERVAKAAEYFFGKIETLMIQPLQAVSVETDNREAFQALQKALETVLMEADRKLFCLKACRSGIVFADFLKVRAQSLFKGQAEKPPRQKADQKEALSHFSHPDLYATLKQWRAARAKEAGQPAFWVLHNTALAEIAESLPVTIEELRLIKGLKSKKGKTLGPEILEMVAHYRKEHHISGPENFQGKQDSRPPGEKTKKPKTRDESLRLFLEGLSLSEVATARGLTLTTIEGHLAHMVGTGKIILNQLMPAEKAARIAAYFQSHPYQGLTPAKEELGPDVSYGELRFVLKDLERQGKLKTGF